MAIRDLFRLRRGPGADDYKASSIGHLLSMLNLGQPVWTPRDYGKLSREAYAFNVVGYRCVSMIARNAAVAPIYIYQRQNDGTLREQPDHPAAALLNKPNPRTPRPQLFEALVSGYLLSGQSYLEGVGPRTGPDAGKPKELWWLRPDRMHVIPGPQGLVGSYRYQANGSHRDFQMDPERGIEPIFQWSTFNPVDDWYGLAPVEAAAYSIDVHNKTLGMFKSLLDNGVRPSGALTYDVKDKDGNPRSLPDEQFRGLKEQLYEQFQGGGNAGKPLLLDGGLKWQQMGLGPKDLQLDAQLDRVARDIAQAFHVPPQLIGLPDASTYSNYEQARMALWEESILPILYQLCAGLTLWLGRRFGDERMVVAIDEDQISALQPRRNHLWDKAWTSYEKGLLTKNEAREMVGYEATEGGEGFASSQPAPAEPEGEDEGQTNAGGEGPSPAALMMRRLEAQGFPEDAARQMVERAYGYVPLPSRADRSVA